MHDFPAIGKRVSLLRKVFLTTWKSLYREGRGWGGSWRWGGRRGKDGPEGLTEELGLHQFLKDEPGFQIDGEKKGGSSVGRGRCCGQGANPEGIGGW